MHDLDSRFLKYGITAACLIFFLALSTSSKAQKVENALLLDVIAKLQAETPYRFLYRESLISHIRISLNLDEDQFIDVLRKQLKPYAVDVLVDNSRYQILLLESSHLPDLLGFVEISGQVVDGRTGERLPYATLSWTEEGSTKGAVASNSGSFRITRDNNDTFWQIKASYVGYEPREITLDISEYPSIRGLTIRLLPQVISGMNVLITDVSYFAFKDSSLVGLVNTGKFSPLGESNAVRSLQVLPSVSLNTALNEGLNIRGSNPDGFQVILDGMSIFNQSHLFGLLDSFNADAIQTNNFFYDVTPAVYQASAGGTLSLLTRTGSQQGFKANAGLSNSSLKGTIEGPIIRGKSSWLISGRHSFMNTINWFSNPSLIKWGLDIDRPKSLLDDDITEFNAEIVDPGDSEARFFDVHAKIYHESRSGSRLMANFYYGGDFTRQTAFRQARTLPSGDSFEAQDVETINDWGNLVAGIHYQRDFGNRLYSQSMVGVSAYETAFSKDDFIYTRLSNSFGNQVSMFTYPFTNRSTLNELKAEQTVDFYNSLFETTIGAAYFYYMGDYYEESFDRPSFFKHSRSSQLDAFGQIDYQTDPIQLQAGSRFHYYSAGKYLKWSPRVRLRLFSESPVTLGAGYSRNYQFLHKVGFANAVTADVWVLSDTYQSPSSVSHYSAGIYTKPFDHTYLQAETYLKKYRNLRLHEINTQTLSNAFAHTPWFHENEGTGKGIEFLMRNALVSFLTVTQTYTLSRMELRNMYLYDGNSFYADWDRRHRYTTTMEFEILSDLLVNLSWNFASGAPNRLTQAETHIDDRLGKYRRLDFSMHYARQVSGKRVDMKLAVFNLFNHKNTWYREYNLALDNRRPVQRLSIVPVDVYDLGFQPSFEVVVSF